MISRCRGRSDPNNDTGQRFITRYGLGRTRVALAMLLTLPGLPSLFTGDEIGAEFEPYRDTRPIVREDRYGLKSWCQRLIELRRRKAALRSPKLQLLDTASANLIKQTLQGLTNYQIEPFLPVKWIRWVGATTAAHACVIQAANGKVYWEDVQPTTVATIEGPLIGPWMQDFKLVTLGSGRVYIYY